MDAIETWDFAAGEEISVEELAEMIKAKKHIDGITLSGGDPFYQQSECVKLLKLLPGVNVWAYTGFKYEEIKDTELAKMCNVIVDGEYIEELKCTGQMYGSSNQNIIYVKGKQNHEI